MFVVILWKDNLREVRFINILKWLLVKNGYLILSTILIILQLESKYLFTWHNSSTLFSVKDII